MHELQRKPVLHSPMSQLCTASQCLSPESVYWCKQLHEPPRLHRKQWEYAYILQVLKTRGMLRPGRRGLGFGVGNEPLVALMAARGCHIVATDLPFDEAMRRGWSDINRSSDRLQALNSRGICAESAFLRNVRFRAVDMNSIDPDLQGFDFVWSSCALEHLGTIQFGAEFVLKSLNCLRRGGVAVHTTEFNTSSNEETLRDGGTVLFRRCDIEMLAHDVRQRGCRMNLNWFSGTDPADRCIDEPPYRDAVHLKLVIGGFVATSIGLVIDT